MKNTILALTLISLTAGAQTIPTVIGTTTTDLKISQLTLTLIDDRADRVTALGSDFGPNPGRIQLGFGPTLIDITPNTWTPSMVIALLPGKLPPGTYQFRITRPDGKSSELPLTVDNPDTGAKLFNALSGKTCKPGEFVTGFSNIGAPICAALPIAPPAPSTFTYNITAQLSNQVQHWPGGSRTFGEAPFTVTIGAPGGAINANGDAWTLDAVSGFASCTIAPARPTCTDGVSSLNNGRPMCSEAGVSRTGNSRASATITCRR
ncbi:MAG: hypothetical protein JST93_26575 [Acidobacteria bacterium]|nr:hypothetical protein [Acidobacteriota bacterium]